MLTTATTTFRKEPQQNILLLSLTVLLFAYWVYGWFTCIEMLDWVLENILVVICLALFGMAYNKLKLSDTSLICIFLFVMLHLYGACYAYTQNPLGEWLQNTYNLWRNPYDRIVHFSFGFLLAYPLREIQINKYNKTGFTVWFRPIEIAFAFGTIFEMIEWAVAAFTTKQTGETYVATQGDVWDAHKDIILAALGAAIMMAIVFVIKKVKQRNSL
jgi:putative membrane protein